MHGCIPEIFNITGVTVAGEDNGADGDEAVASPAAAAAAQAAGVADDEDPLLRYPDGGYWSLPPGQRLRMLLQLCYDALGTAAIR